MTQFLNTGKNVIAVQVYEWGLYEGLLVDCTMEGTELSPLNFWVAFPRWIGFLIFGVILLVFILSIIYIPRRISDKTLIAFINSWEQVSIDVVANEFNMNKEKTKQRVRELITKRKLNATFHENEELIKPHRVNNEQIT